MKLMYFAMMNVFGLVACSFNLVVGAPVGPKGWAPPGRDRSRAQGTGPSRAQGRCPSRAQRGGVSRAWGASMAQGRGPSGAWGAPGPKGGAPPGCKGGAPSGPRGRPLQVPGPDARAVAGRTAGLAEVVPHENGWSTSEPPPIKYIMGTWLICNSTDRLR